MSCDWIEVENYIFFLHFGDFWNIENVDPFFHFTTGGYESIPAKEERGGVAEKEKVMRIQKIWKEKIQKIKPNPKKWWRIQSELESTHCPIGLKISTEIQFLNITTGKPSQAITSFTISDTLFFIFFHKTGSDIAVAQDDDELQIVTEIKTSFAKIGKNMCHVFESLKDAK